MNARPNQKRASARPTAGWAGARTCRPSTSALIAEMAVGGVDYLRNAIALDLTTSDRLPRLRADAKRLSQIVLNLLSNAITFTPEGGRVGVEARLDADDALVLCVTDSGVGIPQEDIAQVLEPFGKSDHECERNPNGTGLGLPMVKRLVEGHGGAFRLESAVGEGTTATVMFPNYRVVR